MRTLVWSEEDEGRIEAAWFMIVGSGIGPPPPPTEPVRPPCPPACYESKPERDRCLAHYNIDPVMYYSTTLLKYT